ncbi:Maf family protein [Caldalkalibacillus salinus]|uniref:Maf family protein n=1 Tax=Caldalkalibacillus salinus TaxID=2803787 RepID=UPI0019211574|nr:Maf family protein [Caldalkalibacillus salinus]
MNRHQPSKTERAHRPIILASASPRRRDLLHMLGLTFTVHPSEVEEVIQSDRSPDKVVQALAKQKAQSVASQYETGIVLGADTVVVDDQSILGKPKNEEEAIQMLSRLQGKVHTVYSGLTLIDLDHHLQKIGYRATHVTMKTMSKDQMIKYVATQEPMDKAGGYAIQGLGATFVERIEGDYFTVVGQPLSLTADYLSQAGVDILGLNDNAYNEKAEQ